MDPSVQLQDVYKCLKMLEVAENTCVFSLYLLRCGYIKLRRSFVRWHSAGRLA